MSRDEIALSLLIISIFVLVTIVMSFITLRVRDFSWSREREVGLRLGLLLGFVWFIALSLCSVPVLMTVPLSNPNRGTGVAVIESTALFLATSIGLIMSRSKRVFFRLP